MKNETKMIAGNRNKILFACVPADGHFNPLTSLAKHLRDIGYEVAWYASKHYGEKLQKLGIHHYPFKKAMDVTGDEIDEVFPERVHIKSKIKKLNFDMEHYFIRRAPEYLQDIQEIYTSFPFGLVIADCAFTGVPLVKDILKVPVIAVGIFPLTETSKDLAPAGLGMLPATSFIGRSKQALLRWLAPNVLFRKPNKLFHRILNLYGVAHNNEFIFDMMSKKADLLLQSGAPGFEYQRSDLGKNVRFIGSLLPYTSGKKNNTWFDGRLNRYPKIVLVTQGTVEKDVNKIIIPTLEAYKNSGTLVVCTTGGSKTAELRKKYPQENIIIEDFIPFNDVMPYADVYITNGGYGGVLLGIENKLPLVVAGVHEGKNEINARIGYFNLGIDLKTESPLPSQLRKAVDEVMGNNSYKKNVQKLAAEFSQYDPAGLCAGYVASLLQPQFSGKEKLNLFSSII